MGWPYLARFSAVSGTGPLVTIVVVTLAPAPKLVAEVAVAPAVVEVVTSVDDVVVEDVAPVETPVSVEVDAGGVSVVVVVEVVAPVSLVGVDGLVVVCWSGVADDVD
jgi:hypothetical protein